MAFQNTAARIGYETPSLLEGTSWPLSRFSFDYWTLISIYEDDWICRRIVDVPAEDMMKAWPSIMGEISAEDIQRVERAIQRTQTRQSLLTGLKWGRLFGGAGSLIVIEGHEDRLEEPLKLDDVLPGSYRGLIPFDMWSGIQPDSSSVCYDFSRPLDVNRPEYYMVRMVGGSGSMRVHSSRILRHVGYENPSPEREVYQWWGISVLQPVFQEIQKRHNVSWNIANMTFRSNILAMKNPEAAQLLSGLGSNMKATQQWERILSETNRALSNQSLLIVPPEGGLESVQYTFSGMDDVYAMFQLDVSGAAEIPFTRFWGRTVTGLGQSNDADERIYEEKIHKDQEAYLRPILEQKLFPVIFMSELGEVPKGFSLQFPSIRVSSEEDKVSRAQAITSACLEAYNAGILSPRAFAQELSQSSKNTGVFTNITGEHIDELPDTPMAAVSEPEAPEMPEEFLAQKAQDHEPAVGGGKRYQIGPFEVVIETPKGEERKGRGWSVRMPADYGYIHGYRGADGEWMDCYVGPDHDSDMVYVVDQMRLDKPKAFDEHKVVLGFRTRNEALDVYLRGHSHSGKIFAAITPMTLDGFRHWLSTADLSKPANSRVGKRWWQT
jgi:phage-related protein (TIGR01555 family)